MSAPVPDDLKAWERQDGEAELEYEAFKGYVYQTPPRRLAHASVRHGSAQLSELYNRWRWSERALAYDRHVQRIRDAERDALLKQDAKERMAKILGVLETTGEILSREVGKLLRDSLAAEASGLLKPSDINKLMNTWIVMQRLVNGESTENVSLNDDSLKALSVEELREFQRLRAKIEAEASDDGDGQGDPH